MSTKEATLAQIGTTDTPQDICSKEVWHKKEQRQTDSKNSD